MSPTLLARLHARDCELFARYAARDRTGVPRRVWTALTHIGGARCTVAAALAPAVFARTWLPASRLALATLIVSHLAVQLIKRTVGRRRPSFEFGFASLVVEPDRFSFPSGHSAAAMSVALAYAIVFPAVAILLIPTAFAVGASRVVLGVHYPGDVLIGQILAAASAASLWLAM
jgi:undecaprenyl-diphosphatase